MPEISIAEVSVVKFTQGSLLELVDQLAIEEPLELHVEFGSSGSRKSQSISVTMRTPGNDAELSAGFLFTEGIIDEAAQVAEIDVGKIGENTIQIRLRDSCVPNLGKADRNFYTTSSCGVCGKASIEAIKTVAPFKSKQDNMMVAASVILRLPVLLREQQMIFNSTGGLHASALFSESGEFMMLREDVGRHNALDKLIGASFLAGGLPLGNSILLLSGRASFELVQKAAMAGIRVIAAVGAPSSLAVQLAQEQDITLIGFLRDERFNIYTSPARIQL